MRLPEKYSIALLVFCIFFMTACAERQPLLYHYNDYSVSYYAYKKDLSDDSLLNLQKSIELAIGGAGQSKSGRVPPGMYANLGYIYLKTGNSKEALTAFTKEKDIYPESAHFMDRMIMKIELTEGTE